VKEVVLSSEIVDVERALKTLNIKATFPSETPRNA
jgi:hypothetical protein